MRHQARRSHAIIGVLLAMLLMAAACSWGEEASVLVRSDPPMTGYNGSMRYTINSSPNGSAETNEIVFQGVNGASPMPLLTTTFGRGANSRTQVAQITDADGTAINALSMQQWQMNVGLTDFLEARVSTYERRDVLGNRQCGAKVRVLQKPNIVQAFLDDKYDRAWDALFYYTVPCEDTTTVVVDDTQPDSSPTVTAPNTQLDLRRAEFQALVITQVTEPRVTGKPIIFNRGHSVTIVGGRASNLVGGWWQAPVGLLNASEMVTEMVKDLDGNEWLDFSDSSNGGLVYSAGDADVYLSLNRIFLNRHNSYLVNFRESPQDDWNRIRVEPDYNVEGNDFRQMYEALKGTDLPDIDDMVDQNTGLPKDIEDPDTENSKKLKEIETAGCQNCPNATLQQIRFVDATEDSATEGDTLYAMTIRGWLGSESSLVMFGDVPDNLTDLRETEGEEHRRELGMNECPIQRNEKGERLDSDHQYSDEECAEWLREGALWDLLTGDASQFGFDVVGQFRVRDNSSWASHCSGSGENTTCNLVATNRRLDASYMFTDTGDKLQKAWTIMQLLGEVGMRTLGLSYASGAYDGSGLDFAMAQPQVFGSYYTNLNDQAVNNAEGLFALDARALQLPITLGQAAEYLYG